MGLILSGNGSLELNVSISFWFMIVMPWCLIKGTLMQMRVVNLNDLIELILFHSLSELKIR